MERKEKGWSWTAVRAPEGRTSEFQLVKEEEGVQENLENR
jgi:hypothetical protein